MGFGALLRKPICADLAAGRGFQVGSGVSEALGAFVASFVGYLGVVVAIYDGAF
jgi:hypothetical protein